MSFALAGALALAGWAASWLTLRGAVAAGLVGGAIFTGTGVPGGVMLALFFISGSLLTAASHAGNRAPVDEKKTARRARQVLANGFWPAVGAVVVPLQPVAGWLFFSGALAAAQADTWATEVGAWSPTRPRSITSGGAVERGASGGVTPLGTVGGIAGALLTGLAGVTLEAPYASLLLAVVAGTLGMIADSLLGASVQARFQCDVCDALTERRQHACGQRTRLVRGWSWLDNDAVNFLATAAGGVVGLLFSFWQP